VSDPLLDSPLVQSIGWALIHFVWQGTAIGIATAMTLRALAGARPATRYGVACFSLVLMLIVPVVAVLTDRVSDTATPAAPAAALNVVTAVPLDRWLPSAVVAWLAGVLLLSVRLVVACAGVERLKRATRPVDATVVARVQSLAHRFGIDRPVRVFESALVRVPTVVGSLRPVILLPASVITGLAPAYLDAVLAHELAHVRRHDYLVNALQSLVETLLFYHPVVWWCSRQIRIEREHCCDDMVVEVGGDRLAYATALAQLEELRGLEPMLSLNASGGRLVDRIRRLLGESPMKERRSMTWTIAAALVVVTALVVTPGRGIADASEVVVSLQSDSRQVEQAPEPPQPPVPLLPDAAAAPPARPVAPAPPAPPALPQAPAALPALPALPAAPVPPLPPQEPLTLDPDSIQALMRSAQEQIAASLEELRRATRDVGLKQEALRQAQAEVAKMKIESAAVRTQLELMQKALSDFSAKKAAAQFDSREMQKLIDELNAQLLKLRAR
jgi:beta-lactamase regulating signal transducer with metallopeptidase domain